MAANGTDDPFTKDVRRNVLALANAYAAATGLTLAQVSKKAYGNAQFFSVFTPDGQSTSIKKVGTMLRWFRRNWPRNADWPMLPPIRMNRTAAEK